MATNLTDEQKKQVSGWLAGGLKLAEVQKRLADELKVHLTYMEMRFLLDDLQLQPKDPEPPKEAAKPAPAPPPTAAKDADAELMDDDEGFDEPAPAPAGAGKVQVSLDQVIRPGALASGKVTFSDGKTAAWYFDQLGRLGIVADDKSYKPSQADLMDFQRQLQSQLARMGM